MYFGMSLGMRSLRRSSMLLVASVAALLGSTIVEVAAAPAVEQAFEDAASGQFIGVQTKLSRFSQTAAGGGRDVQAAGSSSTPEEIAWSVVSRYADKLGLTNPSTQLKIEKSERDSLGMVHITFQQVVGALSVVGGKLGVHVDTRRDSVALNGRVSRRTLDEITPRLTPEGAVAAVQKAWQGQFGDDPLVRAPVLEVLDTGLFEEFSSGNIYLAFRVDARGTARSIRYYVDAQTGVILKWISLATNLNRSVYDCSKGDTCYVDSYDSSYDYTFGRSEGQPARGPNPIPDAAIQAFSYDTDNVYDALEQAHNYWLSMGRNGPNAEGGFGDGTNTDLGESRAYVYLDPLAPSKCPNASYLPDRGYIVVCAGMAKTDIVAHELAHAVVHATADLVYEMESGALNESFADIFGEMTERLATGSNDWLLGPGSRMGTLRSMEDPRATFPNPLHPGYLNGALPDRANSELFYCGTKDHGGVHFNSGVFNHAAYLISEGGSFNGCSITGIGSDKMQQIMYRALSVYLFSSAKFNDAYAAVMLAAMDLYPSDIETVYTALRAVELDQSNYCSGVVPSGSPCYEYLDACPNDSNKSSAGVCGCGVEDSDRNSNGQVDCLDPSADTTPTTPTVQVKKRKAQVSMQSVPGAAYKLTFAKKGAKKVSSTVASSVAVKRLPKGTWKVSYKIVLGGVTTKSSAAKRFVVR